MKRIVNGVAYNTDTSTLIARSAWFNDDNDDRFDHRLYQTRGGAFFVHEHREIELWNERLEESERREEDTFRPLSRERAEKWMLEGDVEVYVNPFDDPPEAEAEAETDPSATIYLRIPASLKNKIELVAATKGQSVNSWAMRCMEDCLRAREESISAWKVMQDFREQELAHDISRLEARDFTSLTPNERGEAA